MKTSKSSSFFIALSIVIALSAVVIWVVRSREIREAGLMEKQRLVEELEVPEGDAELRPEPAIPEPELTIPDVVSHYGDPAELVGRLAKALDEQDVEGFRQLMGGSIDERSLDALRRYAAKYKAAGQPFRFREVGELELNGGVRWAIEGEGEDAPTIYLDLKRGNRGWSVDKLIMPGDPNAAADSLAVAEGFLQAVLSQRFEEARKHVDADQVSDARIAGLCILFEEGEYQMRKQKPLRALLVKDDLAGYLANVEASDGSAAGQFALNLFKQGDPGVWKVAEINLDRLLADYAQRVAGGDVYYSPLVKNPKGGDTLALYFGFDEDGISPRTQRQLEIVAAILKADRVKKLTLSGHTDAKGTDAYNQGLSLRRAEVVRDFLIRSGVQAPQVEVVAMGESQPRRPNVTETGEDNPQGRKVNRRTEIYLDF